MDETILFHVIKEVQLVVDHFLDYLSGEALDAISVSFFIDLHPVTRLA